MGDSSRSESSDDVATAGTSTGSYGIDDLIREGDFINVTLAGVPQGEAGLFNEKVDENGNISMPHIGAFRAEGLTTAQLKEKIEAMYRLAKIYENPNITVVNQQARFVTITGEVRSPQRIFHAKDLTVLGAIATCGGFTNFADRDSVKVSRGDQVIKFNAKEAIRDPSKDIAVLPDDKIQVPRSIF